MSGAHGTLGSAHKIWLPWLAAVLLLVPLVGTASWEMGERTGLQDVLSTGTSRGDLYQTLLQRELERPAGVPLAMAADPRVISALRESGPNTSALNDILASLTSAADLTDLYVMDRRGITVAASNAATDHSFIGHDFSFRRYFKEAMGGKTGHEFALGSASQVPGYYVAQPVRAQDSTAILGAVVAKVELTRLERLWADNPERLVLTDASGTVLLTAFNGLRFQRLPAPDAEGRLRLGNRHYLLHDIDLPWPDWRLTLVLPTTLAEHRRVTWSIVGSLATAAFLAMALVLTERRRTLRAWTEYERRTRQSLEDELKTRTTELIQATKMATIGQMAAGMVHEVNQPLSAIHSFAANAIRFMEMNRLDRVQRNLNEVIGQTERLADITRRLKSFARRPEDRLDTLDLGVALDRVLAMVGPRLREQGVQVTMDRGPETVPRTAVMVRAEQVRLEQVIMNLLSNALDAMRPQEFQALFLSLRAERGMAVLRVADTGPGIAQEHLPRLFEPFYTTKATGEGLGLGLSIAAAIVRDFSGDLTVESRAQGGAAFTVTLPLAETP